MAFAAESAAAAELAAAAGAAVVDVAAAQREAEPAVTGWVASLAETEVPAAGNTDHHSSAHNRRTTNLSQAADIVEQSTMGATVV